MSISAIHFLGCFRRAVYLESEKRETPWFYKCKVNQRMPGTFEFWILNLPEYQARRVHQYVWITSSIKWKSLELLFSCFFFFFSLPLFHWRWLKPTDNNSSPPFLLIHDEFCFLADISTLSWFKTLPVFVWLLACLHKKVFISGFLESNKMWSCGAGEKFCFVSTELKLWGIYIVWYVTF